MKGVSETSNQSKIDLNYTELLREKDSKDYYFYLRDEYLLERL